MIDFAEYPKTVFRFRPYNPLILKELQYGELFFVANDELNDPYDTKNPHFFEGDTNFYLRLIPNLMLPAAKSLNLNFPNLINFNKIAIFLGKEGRLQNELIQLLDSDEFAYVLRDAFANEIRDFIPLFILRFKEKILALGGICYIASFCKTNNDPVMWSHYSNHHKGLCLCFSIVDNKFQSRNELDKYNIFSNLTFEEVIYAEKNVMVNGAFLFSPYVAGINRDETKVKAYWNLRRQSYLTKFSSWKYEQEVRIVVDDWFNVRAARDGIIKRPISERIFHYDQKQLTGIIFGARMPDAHREEVRHVIYELRHILQKNGDTLPPFLFYEAEENAKGFRMEIEPIDGLDSMNKFFQTDEYTHKLNEYNQIKDFNKKNRQTNIN